MLSKEKPTIFILLLLIFLSTASCISLSSKNFGKFVPDADATAAFDKSEINPGLNYYISGSDTYPRSILGLNKEYLLDSNIWKSVALNPEELKELTTRMQSRALDCCRQRPAGFVILDDKGVQIGIWYSILGPSISVKVLDDRKVIIYPPNDKDYRIYDDQGGDTGWGR